MHLRTLALSFVFAAIPGFVLSLHAQSTPPSAPSTGTSPINAPTIGTISGTVIDPLGAIVPGADVQLLDGQLVIASTHSASDGSYAFPIPSSRRFRVRVSAPSFRTAVTDPIYLSSTEMKRLDLTLKTPTLSEQVTVTATGTPTPLAQSGAPITILTAADYPHSPEIQQPLRLIPGVQMTGVGQTGGASSLFLRGADSNATRVLLDGVPVNDVGGEVNFANLSSVGINRIEVLRQPNSALYGSDALAGVVSLSTARGSTPLPLLTYAVDGGNFGLLRHETSLSGAHARLDFYTGFARLDTRNNLENNAFHNSTVAGNYGFTPDSRTDLRVTFRHLGVSGGQPNAFTLYGIADSAVQKDQDTFLNASAEHQTTLRWHNLLRYGHEALHTQYFDYAPTGIPYTPVPPPGQDPFLAGYLGKPVTLTGANGYTVSGQAFFQYAQTYPTESLSTATRDLVYAQSDLRLNSHTVALGAFKYEAERGSSLYRSDLSVPSGPSSTVDRGNFSYTLQVAGDLRSRLFYVLGSGIEDNAVFGKALTPRASLAFYATRPNAQRFFSGTKLHASFGKGIKESNVYEQSSSLYTLLSSLPNGPALIGQYGTRPLGAEYSRNYDGGVEQQFGDGRARVNLTWFHNEFTNGIQFLSQTALVQLGVPYDAAFATAFGAYVNSQAFRSEGAEVELEYRISRRLFARAGYTYLDARVQRSFSSDALAPQTNPASSFPLTPIGQFAPLVGARPFRRAPHSGYFALSYVQARLSTVLSGTLVGRRDDSTFLYDKDFGYSLLLPNRNLDGSYQRLELTTDYRLTNHITTYANLQNLLNQSYAEAFGYPSLPFNVRGGLKFTFGGESWHVR